MNNEDHVVRLSRSMRIQHGLLALSMIMLSLTGLALRYHDSWFGKLVIKLEGGFATRGILHRIFAILLIGVALYHAYYVVFTEEGHRELMKIKPTAKDFRDFWMYLKHNLFGYPELPRFGKYDFRQKFQYWGVVAGSWIMAITGFVLWFESAAMAVLPKWFIDATLIFHGYQGLLIFLVLFLYHLYNVHLNPDDFPMSRVWIDGRISREKLKKYHPLEYEELFGSEETKTQEGGGNREAGENSEAPAETA